MHHAGECPGEGSVLQVAEGFRDLAHAHGSLEETIAGGGDLCMQNKALG